MARPTCLSLLGVRPLLRVFLSRPVFSSFFRVEPGRQMVNGRDNWHAVFSRISPAGRTKLLC